MLTNGYTCVRWPPLIAWQSHEGREELIEENVLSLARERVRIEIEASQSELDDQIGAMTAEFNMRGVLPSGGYAAAVADSCADVAERRCELTWSIIHRHISTTGARYDEHLEAQLCDFATSCVSFADLSARAARGVELSGTSNPNVGAEITRRLDSGIQRGMGRLKNEIGLYVSTLKARDATPSGPSSTQHFTFYSPVGAVMTGANSTATVNQSLDVKGLDATLERIELALQQLRDKPEFNKDEILEVVRDARVEVMKPTQNRVKLHGLLRGVIEAVKTIADLRPAGEYIQAALHALSR